MPYRSPVGGDGDLVARLRRQAETGVEPNGRAMPQYPPASEATVAEAEERLGFPFPPLLRRLYLEVGNGGFGPGFGLVGVEGGHEMNLERGYTVDGVYAVMQAYKWPKRLLAIGDWGCGRWICLEGRFDHGNIVTLVEEELWVTDFTLQSFLEAWLDGLDMHAALFEPGEGRVGINPFTKKPMVFRGSPTPKGRKWP
jgi:hypothetical protein